MQKILQLIRVKHYIKNVFVFMPLFFYGGIKNVELLFNATLAFVAFCLVASSVYILNDINDVEDDRAHSKKQFRPIANGDVSIPSALVLFALLLLLSAFISFYLSIKVMVLILAYFVLNVAYTYILKTLPILDITTIAVGFVIRIFVGASAVSVELSHWIVVMTFLLALFLAAAKRRDDVLIYLQTGKKMRSVIGGYNIKFLDATISMLGSIVIVAYLMYSTSAEVISQLNNQHVYLTSLFVIIGVLKYMHSVLVIENTGSPTLMVFKDRALQVIIVAWLASFAWIIYS